MVYVRKTYPEDVVLKAVQEYATSRVGAYTIARKYKISRGIIRSRYDKMKEEGTLPNVQARRPEPDQINTAPPVYLGGGFQNINMSPTSSIKPLPKSIDDVIKNMDNQQDNEPIRRASSYKAQRSPEEILAGCGGRRGSLLNVVKVSAGDSGREKESKPHKRSKRIKLTDADFIDPVTGQFTVRKL